MLNFLKYNLGNITCIFGISNRPSVIIFWEPGGKDKLLPLVQRTRALKLLSSLHRNTTSSPVYYIFVLRFKNNSKILISFKERAIQRIV